MNAYIHIETASVHSLHSFSEMKILLIEVTTKTIILKKEVDKL